MRKWRVSKTMYETIVVEARSPEKALEVAQDYDNQYNWTIENPTYSVSEKS